MIGDYSSNNQKAVFFDRDGVLIHTNVVNRKPYAIRSASELKIIEGAQQLISKLRALNYRIVVVTNQPDVGNGFVEQQEVEQMHDILRNKLEIDLINVCYHNQKENCYCRKPKTGMFLDAAQRLEIDLKNSIMIGDRSSDITAGKAVGCFTIFIDYAYNEQLTIRPDITVNSLQEINTRNELYESCFR